MRQGRHLKVEDIFFESVELQMPLDLSASQLLVLCASSAAAHERLIQYCGRSATRQSLLELSLLSWVSCFFYKVACLVVDEVAGHCARFTEEVTSAYDSSELDSLTNVQLLCKAEREG